jgi:hypothetical protein
MPQSFVEFQYGGCSDLAGLSAASDGVGLGKDIINPAAEAEDADGKLEQPIVSPIKDIDFVWTVQVLNGLQHCAGTDAASRRAKLQCMRTHSTATACKEHRINCVGVACCHVSCRATKALAGSYERATARSCGLPIQTWQRH